MSHLFHYCVHSDHLNVCPKPVHCPGGPIVSPVHPCGCPDCSKPHPNDPKFAHGYCYIAPSSTEVSYEASSYNSTDTQSSSEGASSSNEEGSSSANWVFNPLYYIVGAGVVSMAAAGIIMRKRSLNKSEQLLNDADNQDENMFSNMSRRIGMLTAAGGAGLVAAMGLGKRRRGPRSGGSVGDLSGSVSRRMMAMEAGDDESAPYYREEAEPPMFVHVPSDGTYTPGPVLVEHPESVEVEGPYRPSSYSACV